jgi:hypothetical protein
MEIGRSGGGSDGGVEWEVLRQSLVGPPGWAFPVLDTAVDFLFDLVCNHSVDP